MCLEHDFGHFNFLKLQDVFWGLDPTPYSSSNPDLILFAAVAADFHVGELRDEVDVLLAVGAVEALVGARLGVQHRLDQAGVRADLQRGVLYQAARSSCSLVCACGHTGLFMRSDTWVVWTWIWDIPTSFLGSSHLQ